MQSFSARGRGNPPHRLQDPAFVPAPSDLEWRSIETAIRPSHRAAPSQIPRSSARNPGPRLDQPLGGAGARLQQHDIGHVGSREVRRARSLEARRGARRCRCAEPGGEQRRHRSVRMPSWPAVAPAIPPRPLALPVPSSGRGFRSRPADWRGDGCAVHVGRMQRAAHVRRMPYRQAYAGTLAPDLPGENEFCAVSSADPRYEPIDPSVDAVRRRAFQTDDPQSRVSAGTNRHRMTAALRHPCRVHGRLVDLHP